MLQVILLYLGFLSNIFSIVSTSIAMIKANFIHQFISKLNRFSRVIGIKIRSSSIKNLLNHIIAHLFICLF